MLHEREQLPDVRRDGNAVRQYPEIQRAHAEMIARREQTPLAFLPCGERKVADQMGWRGLTPLQIREPYQLQIGARLRGCRGPAELDHQLRPVVEARVAGEEQSARGVPRRAGAVVATDDHPAKHRRGCVRGIGGAVAVRSGDRIRGHQRAQAVGVRSSVAKPCNETEGEHLA